MNLIDKELELLAEQALERSLRVYAPAPGEP
jgi:hypothetical protein